MHASIHCRHGSLTLPHTPPVSFDPLCVQVEFQEVLQKVQRLFATDGAAIIREEQVGACAASIATFVGSCAAGAVSGSMPAALAD